MNFYIVILLFLLIIIIEIINAQEKCCQICPSKKIKYFSIPKFQKYNCGETCLFTQDYYKYKLFEPELKVATTLNPCKDLGYTKYIDTTVHSIGYLNANVDLYTNRNLKNKKNNDNVCLSIYK